MSLRVVIGLGSSIAPRERHLALGLRLLARTPGLSLARRSSLYWSPPMGGVARGSFLNAAVAADWEGSLEDLLERCLSIERRLGRRRGRKWADRTLDLDLLWAAGISRDTAPILPHPRLMERAFALIPLLEVQKEAADPRTGIRYRGWAPPPTPLARVGVLG